MQVMHDDDNNITICTALYQSSGFFIIMSPAEGLHFSALVMACLMIISMYSWVPLPLSLAEFSKSDCTIIMQEC